MTMLGGGQPLSFTQGQDGLKVKQPDSAPNGSPYTLKITGLKMNPPTSHSVGQSNAEQRRKLVITRRAPY